MKKITKENTQFIDNLFSIESDEYLAVQLFEFIKNKIANLSPSWHALGFVHCQLAQDSSGKTLRLHVWDSGLSHEEEQAFKIHDHKFDVDSRVLYGSVANTTYNFHGDPNGEFKICRVEYKSRGSVITESSDNGSIEILSFSEVSAGYSYGVRKFELHKTDLASRHALTLVRTSPPEKYNPRVVFPKSAGLPSERNIIPVNKELWMSLVKGMLFKEGR